MHSSLKGWMTAVFLSIAALGAGSAAAQGGDGSGVMVDVGAGKLHMLQAGSGSSTVIFESGFGTDMSAWRAVAPQIAKRAQVLVYSRAGTGQSPARATPVGIEQSSAELDKLIAYAKLKPPFILVGHSYGGFLVRHFAATHPEQVAGIVLVDPADEGLEKALKKIDAAKVAQDQKTMESIVPAKFKGDLALVQQVLDAGRLPSAAPLPDVPAVLLTSVKTRKNAEFFQESAAAVALKRERHQEFFKRFSNGAHVVTSVSGHTIQLEEPALVIAAIDQVILGATMEAQRQAQQQARQVLMQALEKAAGQINAKQTAEAAITAFAALKESQFREPQVNSLGFDVMTKGKQPQLAELILRFNVETFPQSDNALDSYGEVLLALDRPEEAKQQFLKALALAKANDAAPRTIAGYQANLAKADKALNR